MLNFKKPLWVIITLAVALVAVLSVGFAVNKASDNSIDESNNKVIAQGVMYGNDYTTLDFAALSDNKGALNNEAIGNDEFGGSDLVNVTFYGIDGFSRGADIPLTESQEQNIVKLLETVEKIPSDYVRDKDAYPTTVFISVPGEEVIQYCLWSDGMFRMSKDTSGKSPELLDYVSDLILEHTGADLLGYDSNAICGLTSAELTLTRKSPPKDQPDPPVTQFVTDPSALDQIEELFQNARPMQGVSACPFDMLLTMTRADGRLFRYVLADDSCAAAISESGVCMEYGVRNSNGNDRSSFEKIFDSIPWG